MRKQTFAMAAAAFFVFSMAACAAAFTFTFENPAATEEPAVDNGEARAWTYPISREILEDPLDVLRLVNKEYPLEKNYESDKILVKTSVRKSKNSEQKLRDMANEAMTALFDAASADGITLYLNDAYRDFRTQEVLYYNRLKAHNGKDDGLVQKEGASEHQMGLAADIVGKVWIGKRLDPLPFSKTKESQWLAANCARFGFIIRYPDGKTDITGIQYEPWHLRYVGVEVAQYVTEMGYTLEEFTQERLAVLSGEWSGPDKVDFGVAMGESEDEIAYEVDSFSF